MTLVFLNSTLNPLIYCWEMKNIRHTVVDMLRHTFSSFSRPTEESWIISTMHHTLQLISKMGNRGERSLSHVATVAKFQDDNISKTSLKIWIRTVSNLVNLIQFHLICQILAKFSRVESESTASKLRKRPCIFVLCSRTIKRTREIRKFYVAVVQWWLKNV